jgi:hypothetical protein
LDEDPSHEAEGAGDARLLDFDGERFLSELLGLGAAPRDGRESRPFSIGKRVPTSLLQDLPEAMRTVVSTRQGRTYYAAKLMSLSELKDSSRAKTVFQLSPVGDTMLTAVSIAILGSCQPSALRK